MACRHKFINYLQLQKLDDFKPKILVVGTFNPEWPEGNYAEWFYGRTDNNYFWDILPRMFQDQGLRNNTHVEWKIYCKRRKIALTDLISCIEDADIQNPLHRNILGEYTDSKIASSFKRQISNSIIPLLQSNQSIESVYLTTTSKAKFWQNLWNPIEEYCNQRNIWCQSLTTPSKGARFFMTKGSGVSMPDFIYNDWLKKWKTYE